MFCGSSVGLFNVDAPLVGRTLIGAPLNRQIQLRRTLIGARRLLLCSPHAQIHKPPAQIFLAFSHPYCFHKPSARLRQPSAWGGPADNDSRSPRWIQLDDQASQS